MTEIQSNESWHELAAEQALLRLETSLSSGLRADEASRRLARYGRNELEEGHRRAPWRILLDQFADFMIVVLIAAAVISGVVGEPQDTFAIIAILIVNAVIGFVQEYRAEKAMAALAKIAALNAQVMRDGGRITVPARDLVPGDIVLLDAGNVVPADLRLVEAVRLKVDEAALTGESVPVEKMTGHLPGSDAVLADRRNMAYKGTVVTYGRGTGVVTATGMATELGRIAALLASAGDGKTPLQKRLGRFGARLAVAVLAICAIVFVAGLLRGEPAMLMLLTAISLAVAAIPEALPAVVTVSLALGAVKMVKRNALIRRLPAVETLGSVTYICSDKTGTLTLNRMRVEQMYCGGELAAQSRAGRHWESFITALALSNDAARAAGDAVLGDPTELALYEAADAGGMRKETLLVHMPRVGEIPFDSERKRMTTMHSRDGGVIAYVKGAPESLLPLCTTGLQASGTPFDHDEVLRVAERMAGAGLRVLAIASRQFPSLPVDCSEAAVEQDLVFLGLAGMLDPPRPEAAEAVAMCRSAGIVPVMITGDHPATAANIARRLGILEDGAEVMTGRELAKLTVAELARRVARVGVYARVAPEQKIMIVRALQERGEFVAMTGDGVNDAPALKRADIGIAMGITGSDVAKEAAHMVLLDDNFATIVGAVREGRRIFDNIRKFIRYAMTGNSGEIWTIFLAPFLGMPIPLLPIHILWVNLVTDGVPGLALAAEPAERGLMQRAPRSPAESVFSHGMWQHIVWVGLLMGAASLVTQAFAMHAGWANWQTMVFTVLTLSQLGHVLAIRSERQSLFEQGLKSNLPLAVAVTITFGLQMATVYVPWLNPVFRTAPLSATELAFCLTMSSLVFAGVECEKWMVRRGWLYREESQRTVSA